MQHPANQHSDKSSNMVKIPDRGEGPQTGNFVGKETPDTDWGQLIEIEAAAPHALPPSLAHPAFTRDDDYGQLWPPGRAGVFARLIFDTSYSPVREVAIAATLGLLAGVCGRAYRTYTGKDLALYLILIAKSGIGKDSTHDGIPMLLKLAAVPMAERFVRAQDFVSGEALHKELLREPGFLALQGEFGRKMKRMSNPTDTPMQSLRTVMTNAYGKRFLEGKSYSNADNTLAGVDWPALSFLGETTPATFLECLTPDMMADGFLSRFLCITYAGQRPLPNRYRDVTLDESDLSVWKAMVGHMVQYQYPINMPAPCIVQPDDDAQEKLEGFELDCIADLNGTEDESERQVWSRAHLKALKVASLLAVADNPFNPVVRITHVAWALNLVRADIGLFQTRKRGGDVGNDDNARERKLVAFMREYLVTPVKPSYKVPDDMRQNGIVPRRYLQIRAASLPAFNNHKLGATRALDDTIKSLVVNGHLLDVKRDKMVEDYSFFGNAFRILSLPD
jgi:Protein of unknown function (DUF3987)